MYTRTLPLVLIGLSLAACTFRPTIPSPRSFSHALLSEYIEENTKTVAAYRQEAMKLESNEWSSGEVEVVGGTLGVGGAIASSIPIAAGGAVLYGGSELLSTFYGYEKQTDAYLKAYYSATCLQTTAKALKPDLFYAIAIPPGSASVEAYAVDQLNRASEKVHNRLFESLRMRAVSQAPNFGALQASIEAAMTAKPAAGATLSNELEGAVERSKEEIEAQKLAIGRLESNVELCLAL